MSGTIILKMLSELYLQVYFERTTCRRHWIESVNWDCFNKQQIFLTETPNIAFSGAARNVKRACVRNTDHGVEYQCVVNFHVCGWRGAVRCRKRPLTNCFGESAGRCRDHIPTNWSRSRRCGKRRLGHPTRRAASAGPTKRIPCCCQPSPPGRELPPR